MINFFQNFKETRANLKRLNERSIDTALARSLLSDPHYLSTLAEILASGTVSKGTQYHVLWMLVLDRLYKINTI